MQLDLSADHLCWDQVESVGYESARRGDAVRDVVPIAKRRAIRGRQKSPSNGVYVGYEVSWVLPARELPQGLVPKPGDAVVDGDGRRWTVLTTDERCLRQRWALGCVDLELALDLQDAIDIERATVVTDSSGAGIKRFPSGPNNQLGGRVLYASLPARVQLVSEEVQEVRDVRAFLKKYEVHVASPVPFLCSEDRIRWTDRYAGQTRYLDVVGVRKPEQLDELWAIDAELRP